MDALMSQMNHYYNEIKKTYKQSNQEIYKKKKRLLYCKRYQ